MRRIANMIEARTDHVIVQSSDSHLLAIGGLSTYRNKILDSVETYNIM